MRSMRLEVSAGLQLSKNETASGGVRLSYDVKLRKHDTYFNMEYRNNGLCVKENHNTKYGGWNAS